LLVNGLDYHEVIALVRVLVWCWFSWFGRYVDVVGTLGRVSSSHGEIRIVEVVVVEATDLRNDDDCWAVFA
jgi:hypothetical protein